MTITLALTVGDPTGIGPEITLKALQKLKDFPDIKFVVIGSLKALDATKEVLHLSLPKTPQVTYMGIESDLPGTVAYKSIETAVQLIAKREADGMVTGPISKRNLLVAGLKAHGHTEILEDLARSNFNMPEAKAEMLFVYKKFRLLLLTRHIPLHEVSRVFLKYENISKPVYILLGFLKERLAIVKPKLAILGVNPHAGEVGGYEEKDVLMPLIESLERQGLAECTGPLPADGFFRGLHPQNSGYDAVIAAYHDQGLIPLKLLAGYEAVNVTIGLPFLRTSVSHGTAEDIAGQGIAREDSLLAAIRTAVEILAKSK